MNTYKILKEKHQKEVNDFPMFFAFSESQFNQGMKTLGLDPSETDKIYSLSGTGGYYRREDSKALHAMFDRHETERKQAMLSDDKYLLDMFCYELNNHEYSYTGEVEDTLDALGLTYDEINNNERLLDAFQKACQLCS